MAVGRFALHHSDGVDEFNLTSATIQATRDKGGIRLWFEVVTDSLPDTGARLNAKVGVTLTELDAVKLSGMRFSVPRGVDDAGEQVAYLSCLEDSDLDDNELEVLGQDGNKFHVRWTGTTADADDDGGDARSKVEIDGWFTFRAMHEWLPK